MDGGAGFGARVLYLTLRSPLLQALYAALSGRVAHGRSKHNGGGLVPHLALCYLSDASPWPFDAEKLAGDMWGGGLGELVAGGGFGEGWDLGVWKTEGKVGDWEEVAKVKLC
jgi:hypothetical protein